MKSLATEFAPAYPYPSLLVTEAGTVRLTPESVYELVSLCGKNWFRPDMRTRAGKLARHIESDINYLALLEWIEGNELTQL